MGFFDSLFGPPNAYRKHHARAKAKDKAAKARRKKAAKKKRAVRVAAAKKRVKNFGRKRSTWVNPWFTEND